jgi:hypothetical protein
VLKSSHLQKLQRWMQCLTSAKWKIRGLRTISKNNTLSVHQRTTPPMTTKPLI